MQGYLAGKHSDDVATQFWFIPVRVTSPTVTQTLGQATTSSSFEAFKQVVLSTFCSHLTTPANILTHVFPSDNSVILWGSTALSAAPRSQRDVQFVEGDELKICIRGNSPLIRDLSTTKLAPIPKSKYNAVNADDMFDKIAAMKAKSTPAVTTKDAGDDEWAD
eukprot:c2770_g1_i1.p1 GENE.c2770_g1_i1~~c2770_g1_i1.p1  ORF type:complete len:163 (-),score=35.89 c2770_g1_i1:57-545(-)